MKRESSSIWLSLLLTATVILSFFSVSIFSLVGMLLYDSDPDVAKSLTHLQRQYVHDTVQMVLCFASIPMAVLAVMWMLAFFCERRNLKRMRKRLRKQQRVLLRKVVQDSSALSCKTSG
jgi:hypothetical protein